MRSEGFEPSRPVGAQALNLPRMPFRHDRVSAPGFEPGKGARLELAAYAVPPSALILASGIEPDPSAYRAAARTSDTNLGQVFAPPTGIEPA